MLVEYTPYAHSTMNKVNSSEQIAIVLGSFE